MLFYIRISEDKNFIVPPTAENTHFKDLASLDSFKQKGNGRQYLLE